MVDEREAQFAIHLRRHDAEIEADVDEDSADRAAANLGFDFLGRGQAIEILGRSARRDGAFGARFAWGAGAGRLGFQIAATSGAPAEPGFERGGAEQTAPDAGEDPREIGGAKDPGDEFETGEEMQGSGVLQEGAGEILAVGDEPVYEAEEAGNARWHGPSGLGPMGIELDVCDRFGGGVGHKQNKNTKAPMRSIKIVRGTEFFQRRTGVVGWWCARAGEGGPRPLPTQSCRSQ